MATKAFQKIYTKISQITKATCSLKATGVGYDELAMVNGKLAQVVKIAGDEVTLQVFEGTEGIPTNAEVVFLGKSPTLKVSEQLAGRFFNAFGDPIDGGPEIEGVEVEIGGPSVNPVRRKQPSELIATGIAGIDLNNTLVSGQKIPFFADPDQPFNQVMANVALRAETDKIILGGMGMTNDDYLYFKNVFSNAGALDRIISFVNTTENPPVERLLIPDMALTAAEYFAVEHNQKVLVLLTDMTSYADALAIVSNRMDQIPSKDSMPGSLYSDLAEQEDGQDPHRLFDQLGDSRNTGGPAPQIISHDAAVKGGKGEGIGEDHKELGAAGLLKKSLGDPPGEALKEKSAAAGGGQGKKDSGAQKFPGLFFPAGGDPSRHAAGEGGLDAGAGQGETKGIDGKDQLVEPYAFLAESVA